MAEKGYLLVRTVSRAGGNQADLLVHPSGQWRGYIGGHADCVHESVICVSQQVPSTYLLWTRAFWEKFTDQLATKWVILDCARSQSLPLYAHCKPWLHIVPNCGHFTQHVLPGWLDGQNPIVGCPLHRIMVHSTKPTEQYKHMCQGGSCRMGRISTLFYPVYFPLILTGISSHYTKCTDFLYLFEPN